MEFPKVKGRAFLSPMSGVTDVAFRALCKKYGAALTYTEFVSSAGIIRENKSSSLLLRTDPSEKPVATQLFGKNVQEVIYAAQYVEDKFDVIDINCGCPAWKVIKTGAGSELLKKPQGIATLISKLTNAVNTPITIKIRTGIDDASINAVEVAKQAEDAGAAAIAIHGRTQKQGYSGTANWEVIKNVKQAVNIPVIGNGDVFTPEQFDQRIKESGVDYIMIARGAIGNPYIFKQIDDFMKNGSYQKDDRIKHFKAYLKLAKKYDITTKAIKTHAMNFTKSMVGGKLIREELSKAESIADIEQLMQKEY